MGQPIRRNPDGSLEGDAIDGYCSFCGLEGHASVNCTALKEFEVDKRDRQVAKETVRAKDSCPHCNPGAAKGLTLAGCHLREVAKHGTELVEKWSYVPCAQEHEDGRICILPLNHDPIPRPPVLDTYASDPIAEGERYAEAVAHWSAEMERLRIPKPEPTAEGFWDRLGQHPETFEPTHLPMGVNEHGQGPENDSEAHHYECWCIDPYCPLNQALKLAGDVGARTALREAKQSEEDDELVIPPTPTDDDTVQLVAKMGIIKNLLSGRNLNLFPIPQYKDDDDLPSFGIRPGGL